MATKKIAWSKGGGYITLTYMGTGDSSVLVESDANDLHEIREQQVQLVTSIGFPQRDVSLLIRQEAKRGFDYTFPVALK